MIYGFTFIPAFCSIVYELLLGQSLSAFLENTVLRYSVTIGLYMLSMGIGALSAEGRFVRHPVTTLLKVEILLTVVGATSVLVLHLLDSAGLPGVVFSALAHGLIVLIGVLTGFEIPLLIELRNAETTNADSAVLGIDYLGAFAGTILFAFLFYPLVGLIPTAFIVASLNAAVGVALATQVGKVHTEKRTEYWALIGFQTALLAALVVCLPRTDVINEWFLGRYLGL